MKFKFIGQSDEIFPDLVYGKVYDLEIKVKERGFILTKEYPMIVSPIRCPYSSWDTFYLNWKRI